MYSNNTIMKSLEELYREDGLVCPICDKPYVKPERLPSANQTRCKTCWPNTVRTIELWADLPIIYRMEQIELRWKNASGLISDDDPDYQDDIILKSVIQEAWDVVRSKLEERNTLRPQARWNGMSRFILVEACSNPNTPPDIIRTLFHSGVDRFETKACINPFGIGTMTPIMCAAECNNLEAVKVIAEEGYATSSSVGPMSIAAQKGHVEILDYLWTIPYSYYSGHDHTVNTTMGKYCSTGILREYAKENGHWKAVKAVIHKHIPNYGKRHFGR